MFPTNKQRSKDVVGEKRQDDPVKAARHLDDFLLRVRKGKKDTSGSLPRQSQFRHEVLLLLTCESLSCCSRRAICSRSDAISPSNLAASFTDALLMRSSPRLSAAARRSCAAYSTARCANWIGISCIFFFSFKAMYKKNVTEMSVIIVKFVLFCFVFSLFFANFPSPFPSSERASGE